MAGIDQLIINSAFREPAHHWKYDLNGQTFVKEPGRRPAGYFIAGQGSNQYNDIGQFIELPLVNKIRPRVKAWRQAGYPGVTGVTQKLLDHWNDKDARQYQFFFCQMDAIETIIWLTEAPEADKVGIEIPGDGGVFRRICTKLCTGGGKTTVMAMLIAWMVCNKATYPQDKRFSKNVFIVAPGLTVKSRLQVLQTGGEDNYYTQFNVVPIGLMDKLRQGKVLITNWQALAWDSEEAIKKRRSVDKRGAKSDEAYTREVLGEMANAQNILVINDEAHHAWRKNPENKGKLTKEQKEAEQEATIWISGLDRIHKTRSILTCYDFSATPFAPSGKKNDEEALFGWIVSDFGLNDGIESGLVKTPRVVVRDDGMPDAATFRSKLYHIYADETVKDDINRPAPPEEPLPDLLTQAYYLLGKDWQVLYQAWKEAGAVVPPVMITVANRTETAARIKYAFDHQRIPVPELCVPELTIHIDSKTMDEAEGTVAPDHGDTDEDGGERKLSKKEAAAILRETVDTVGQRGKRGEQIRNVISVGMLSEGWDAKTVTHILGLRAFSSQLLCEQVVGRGLRRTSYDLAEGSDMFTAEYVNIFGIPFTFLPHESDETGAAPTTPPKTQVESLRDRMNYEISWPNIVRIDREFRPKLSVDLSKIETLVLEASDTRLRADLAPIIDGKTDLTKCTEIDLQKLDAELRMQRIVFEASGQVYDLMKSAWKSEGTKYALLGQVIRLVEEYLKSGAIVINPPLFNTDPVRQRIIYMMNMNKIVQHLWGFIKLEQTKRIVPIFDANKRVRSTSDMPTWFTSKPCYITKHSQISHCVFDSTWESTESYVLEKNPHVTAWAKNDHLGFEILYVFDGVVRKYTPDFLVKLDNGKTLVLETKGQETRRDKEKRKALAEWIAAVNQCGEFGIWCNDVSYNVADVDGIIQKHLENSQLGIQPQNVRLYIEAYDPTRKMLFLDFMEARDFLLYKFHENVALDYRLEEGTPTILVFEGIALETEEPLDGMVVEVTYEDLWSAPGQSPVEDSDLISTRYTDSAANFMLKAIQNRREVRNHEIKSIPTTWKGTPASLENLGSDFSLSVMCVGQGSWNEIFDTAGNYTIFDCGTFLSASSQERAECLKQNGGLVKPSAKVTSLIISHWDCDHYNLLRNISDTELSQLGTAHFPNQLVSLTSLDIAKRIYKCCQKTEAIVPPRSSQRSSRLKNYCHGQRYRLYIGEARKSLNHSGTALEVHSKKECALLTADHTYKQIFEDMYPNTDKDLILNMVVPHHGGNAGQMPSPIYICKPGIAIISTDGVSYGHPLPKVMNRLKTEGFQIYRTDVIGTNITLTL